MIGTTLGHFRIVEKLGAGGMGEVYRARDEHLQRDVALKILSAAMLGDDAARRRLLREAETASALNHPHICTIHEVGEASGQAYIVMEHVRGRTLSSLITEAAPMPAAVSLSPGQGPGPRSSAGRRTWRPCATPSVPRAQDNW